MFWILYALSLFLAGFWFNFEMIGYSLPSDWTEDNKWWLELLVSFIPVVNVFAALCVVVEALFPGVDERGR